MTPISTAGTDIDEVLILRKARRLGSHVRNAFSTHKGRASRREKHQMYLARNPFSPVVFERFLSHVGALLEACDPDEEDALKRGFF